MRRIVVALLLLFPFFAFSQSFINKDKQQVKALLDKYKTGPGFEKPQLSETDSTIRLTVKDSSGIATDFIYQFDKAGKCQVETTQASCDSCFKKYLDHALSQQQYGWKKINENQYISKYQKKMMIELPAEKNDFSFMIIRTDWSKKIYRLLTSKQPV